MQLPRFHRLRKQLYYLEGSACKGCGEKHFPPRAVCPRCQAKDVEAFRLGGRGELYSYSEVYSVPRGYTASVPYAVGLIRLDEGVMVLAQLTDIATKDVKIGMRLEAVTRKLKADGERGYLVYGYKFRPVME